MLNKKLKRGFTLIELLVVITIIGILATGAVAVYTAQIQKARDSTRINDIKAIQSGVEQVYQDSGEYPHSNEFATGSTDGRTGVKTYVELIPSDAKFGQTCNNGNTGDTPYCGYVYGVSVDSNGIEYGEYELSTAFENNGNVGNKADNDKDHGNDDVRFEIGINVNSSSGHITEANKGGTATSTSSGCVTVNGGAVPTTGTVSIYLGDDC